MPLMHMKCKRCGKNLSEKKYFITKTGEYYPICKECLMQGIDNKKPSTFLWLMRELDVPFIQNMWLDMCKKLYKKNPERFGPASVFGSYYRILKTPVYKNFGYEDSVEANKTYNAKNGYEDSAYIETFNKDIRRKLENPDLPEEERERLKGMLQMTENTEKKPSVQFTKEAMADDKPEEYEILEESKEEEEIESPENEVVTIATEVLEPPKKQTYDFNSAFEEMEQEAKQEAEKKSFFTSIKQDYLSSDKDQRLAQQEANVAANLTNDDIRELSIKWGNDYRPTEWLRMEQMYRRYADEYELNVDREEVLKKMCKTSIKMDQALDDGNMADYSKLATVFDQLRKSGKFTEAQNKDKQDKYLDSVGELVAAVEKEGGIIPKFDYKYEVSQDKVDLTIKDCQSYLFNLVRNEMGLGNLIESYIQKLDQQAAQQHERSLGDGLITSRDEEDEAYAEADSWMQNLQDSIAADAEKMFAQLDEE